MHKTYFVQPTLSLPTYRIPLVPTRNLVKMDKQPTIMFSPLRTLNYFFDPLINIFCERTCLSNMMIETEQKYYPILLSMQVLL